MGWEEIEIQHLWMGGKGKTVVLGSELEVVLENFVTYLLENFW